MSCQDNFIQLVKEITQLQWVRESLPSHSKYYEGLKKKLEKQTHLKSLSEKELKDYQSTQDSQSLNTKLFKDNTTIHGKSYSNIIESVRFYESAIELLKLEIQQAEEMLEDLNLEKQKLDDLCSELHVLYDKVIMEDPEDSSYIFGQHLKNSVQQLATDIPNIKKSIKTYEKAQAKLYEAREHIESAMKSLPGASTFLDRQAIAVKYNNSLLGKRPLMIDSIRNADKIASRSYQLVAEASQLCSDAPNIPSAPIQRSELDVVILLTHYRGYRLKIETVLRTRLNPRLYGYKNQLATAKYHYEQRVIEWIDHQIITLETCLRANGYLVDNDLNREISMLRMGSRAAIAAVASETSERVTVDDALEIFATEGSALPEYAMIEPSSSSDSSSHADELDEATPAIDPPSCVNNIPPHLPSYTIHEHPPAYSL